MLERVIKEIDSLESEIKHLRNDIDPDEIAHWKEHPVTKLLRLELLNEYATKLESSANSVVSQQDVVIHAESRGMMKGLEMVLDWEINDEQED
jgi:hypothetical protein